MNRERRKLVKKIEGVEHMECNIIEDEEGEYTFTRDKGNIDYVIGDKKTRGRIINMKIGEKVDSDYPLEIWVEDETQRKRKKYKEQKIRKIVWDSMEDERSLEKI